MSMKLVHKFTKDKGLIDMREMRHGDVATIPKSNQHVLRVGGGEFSIWLILNDHVRADWYDYTAAQYHSVRLLTKEETITCEFRGQP